MDTELIPFDFQRIFFGNTPLLFLMEIVFRTVIMYTYTLFLIRLLGKRGIGQFSGLELAIIICFGSAVGDPMIVAEMPLIYGIVGVTTVAFIQIILEKIINKHKKLEILFEGKPNVVVDNGIILFENLHKESFSHEDLFRSLRIKDVEHLGQVNKAFLETTGEVTVWFSPPKKIYQGMLILPDSEIPVHAINQGGDICDIESEYSCRNCGYTSYFTKGARILNCKKCNHQLWLNNTRVNSTTYNG